MGRTPTSDERQRMLRSAVVELVRSERRRSHPAVLHVGAPGGTEVVFALDPADACDHSLRTDVVAALLSRTTRGPVTPMVWLTRTGELEIQDVDAAWAAAARTAYAEAGVALTMVVVNRRGWRDPTTGESRQWVRIRV